MGSNKRTNFLLHNVTNTPSLLHIGNEFRNFFQIPQVTWFCYESSNIPLHRKRSHQCKDGFAVYGYREMNKNQRKAPGDVLPTLRKIFIKLNYNYTSARRTITQIDVVSFSNNVHTVYRMKNENKKARICTVLWCSNGVQWSGVYEKYSFPIKMQYKFEETTGITRHVTRFLRCEWSDIIAEYDMCCLQTATEPFFY